MPIWKLAEAIGFEAFSSANIGASVLYYSAQNMREERQKPSSWDVTKRKVGGAPFGGVSRVCYAFNSEQGCDRGRSADSLVCSKSRKKGHKRSACKD